MIAMTIHDVLDSLVGRGLSQSEIARLSGVPQPTISRLITRKHKDVSYADGKKLETLLASGQIPTNTDQKEAA